MTAKNTPSWVKRHVRMRQKETGEKYTTALRAIREQLNYNPETNRYLDTED